MRSVRPADLKRLLGRVRRGTLSPAAAARAIGAAPVERLEFATLDHQRSLRVGFPEVIFGLGKTPRQVVAIATRLAARHPVILATRLAPEAQEALRAAFPKAEIHARARVAILRRAPRAPERGARRARSRPAGVGRVLVICAGTADLPVAEEALHTARVLGSRAELIADVGVAGLHRLLAHSRKLRGARVLVVVAGLEGALPSVVGGLTDRPLIAVPTSVGYGAHFRGLAPLLAMLNSCAAGVTVVNVDNGFGAGYAAHLINTCAEQT
jgi:NCAIR mutase (PurE)-related protein